MRARIISPLVIEQGVERWMYPRLIADYPDVSLVDATARAGDAPLREPAATVLDIECDLATLAAIQADRDYVVLYWET